MEQRPSANKKPGPPTLGLAIVADFWLWGALLLLAPSYFTITSGWRVPFLVLGFISLTISFGGALLEIGKLRKSEGLSYWGVSLVFLVPAAALFLSVRYGAITGALAIASKIAVLLLAAIGGPLFFQGLPYFFWKTPAPTPPPEQPAPPSPSQIASAAAKRKTSLEIIANVIVALLALATAIVALVEKILR
jgi:hypothetical protein